MAIRASAKKLLILILIFTAFFRLFRIDYPNKYIFDEVYHAFTAKEYLNFTPESWEWWTKPPPGVAYEWTHPPLSKEIMAFSMLTLGNTDAWSYRLPGALLGILGVFVVYLVGLKLFKKQNIALLSALIFSIDGLNFVQSRTGMNDVYFVTFTLITILFLLQKRFLLSSIFLGLTLATKWTGIYTFGLVFLIVAMNKSFPKLLYFLLIPPIIYLLSYIPFFLVGHDVSQFIELQKQMWWYHTSLRATHDYASSWWSWPLNLYPVWYYVEYFSNNTLANIFASGNPVVFWLGFGAILVTVYDGIKHRSKELFIVLAGFLAFILPWALSPRIMFLYHYSPCIPFLSLALGYQLVNLSRKGEDRKIITGAVILMVVAFLLFYPILTGFPISKDLLQLFFQTNLTKNPFAT